MDILDTLKNKSKNSKQNTILREAKSRKAEKQKAEK
jgi:hypothetical protein